MFPNLFSRRPALFCQFALWLALGLLSCSRASTQTVPLYHVRVDTSALFGRGTYVLDYQLIDGALLGNGNATAEISNVTLNGGALGTVLPIFGTVNTSVRGSLQDTLTLRDGPSPADYLVDYAQEFAVTSTFSELHFDLRLRSLAVETLFLDSFAFAVLDSTLAPLATSGPFGLELVSADYDTTTPIPFGYATLEAPLLVAEVTLATAGLSSVTLDKFSVAATLPATGTIKLNTPAPAGGTVVTLTSSAPGAASVPTRVTVPANATSATFPVITSGVAAETNVTITARAGTVTRTVVLQVQPLLQSFTLEKSAVCGASTLNATVTLRSPRPTQTTTVTLFSGLTTVLSLPASVTLPVGQTSLTFPVNVQSPESAVTLFLRASAAGATLETSLNALPDPLYLLTDLGTLGGSSSLANAINGAGQVTGSSETLVGDTHAFLWQDGSLTDLDTPGGQHSAGYAINAAGQVAGEGNNPLGDRIAFRLDGPDFLDLGTLGGQNSSARGHNLYGRSAGFSETSVGDVHAFLSRSGDLLDLGALGGQSSRAFGVSDRGQVVGEAQTETGDTHAFLWQNGLMTDLGTLEGQNSRALAINAAGQVIGSSETASGAHHAFLWQNGILTDLGSSEGQNSEGRAINAYGQIVGTAETLLGMETAFLACLDVWRDLNAQIVNPEVGWLSAATGINERGEIVGYGQTEDGVHAMLLTPIPAASPRRTVAGTVALQECLNPAQPITFLFRRPTGEPLFVQTVTLGPYGQFVLKGIPSGLYMLAVKGLKWLRRTVSVDVRSGSVSGLSLDLPAGDANDDNSADALDLADLITAFNTEMGEPGYNDLADFNGDSFCDALDLALLIDNFNTEGDL